MLGVGGPVRLRRFIELRGIDADRGLGAYVFPSFKMSFAGRHGDLVTGISSATSVTGLRASLASADTLPFEVLGDMGV